MDPLLKVSDFSVLISKHQQGGDVGQIILKRLLTTTVESRETDILVTLDSDKDIIVSTLAPDIPPN